MGGSASSSPVVQKSLANFMDAMSGGVNSQPALDQYSKQFRNMPDAVIRGVGDAVASIPDLAIAGGKLALQGGFNPRMGQSERVNRFADTTYMPINPMMQDALTRAGVAETEGGNNLTRFVSGAMAPYAMGKYAGAVGDAIGAAKRGTLSNAERGMVKLADDLPEASRMARATSKYKPKIVDGSTFPDPDTQKGRMAIQGGPLAAKPGIDRLITTLDSHGMDWKYSENGGITAYAEVLGADGKWFKEGKHFDEKSSLKTLRNWLGY